MPKATATTASAAEAREGELRFSLLNWSLLAAGVLCVVLGYVALSGGSTALAPLLLVLGYVILVPLGIIL
jgi:hypothetical protein